MGSEREWQREREQFVAEAAADVADRPAEVGRSSPVSLLGRQFATLAHSLLGAMTVDEVLQRVLRATVIMVPAAKLASITVLGPDGRVHTPAETDPRAGELDQLQYQLQEGPCLDAAAPTGPAVAASADLRADPAWPRWAPAAVELGVESVVSTALVFGGVATPARSVGTLNVYSALPGGLDAADRDVLLLLATHASLAVAGTEAVSRARSQHDALRRALDSRDVIGQAKGIIMVRRGVSAGSAFDILRRTSQELNIKLVDLAAALATRPTELDLP